MDVLHSVLYGFSVSLQPANLLACFAGVVIGTLVGVLPGIGSVAAMSLLFPVTYTMSPTAAIILMAGVYYGAMYGGSTTSILVNIPGEAASVVTCLDGHPLARQGRGGAALGMAAFGSFIAGTLGVIGITVLAPPLARLALRFGPPEISSLLFLGFTMISYLAGGSKLKAAAMALLGLLLGTVGLDPIVGTPRFTYGSVTLLDGIGFVPMIMGLFGIAEVLLNLERSGQPEIVQSPIRGVLPTRQDWKDSGGAIARGSVLGFFLGILPGIGAIVPTFLSYGLEKRLSKHPERFGAGAIEGVAGPESANNAAAAGSLIPLLTLGIPPNVVMAVLLGAFLVHGVQPGPLLMQEHPEIFWGVVTSMYVGNAMLLALNLPLIGLWVQLLRVPYHILFPLILLCCMVGAYSVNSNVWDIVTMLLFGAVGYWMKQWDYDPVPLVLAFVLGRMAEESIRQSLVLSRGSLGIFLARPLSAVFLITAALLVLLPWLIPQGTNLLRKLQRQDGPG